MAATIVAGLPAAAAPMAAGPLAAPSVAAIPLAAASNVVLLPWLLLLRLLLSITWLLLPWLLQPAGSACNFCGFFSFGCYSGGFCSYVFRSSVAATVADPRGCYSHGCGLCNVASGLRLLLLWLLS
jgi:hypothetical protein